MNKPLAITFFSILFSLSTSACSSSTPSASEAEAYLQERINSDSPENKDRISLKNFKLLNGEQQQRGRVSTYLMHVEYELEFKQACRWVGLGQSHFTKKKPDNFLTFAYDTKNTSEKRASGPVTAGDSVKISTIITYKNTENGWKPGPLLSSKFISKSIAKNNDSNKHIGFSLMRP